MHRTARHAGYAFLLPGKHCHVLAPSTVQSVIAVAEPTFYIKCYTRGLHQR